MNHLPINYPSFNIMAKPLKFPGMTPNGGGSPLHLPSALRAQKLKEMGLGQGWKLVTDGEIQMILRDMQDSKKALATQEALLGAALSDRDLLDWVQETYDAVGINVATKQGDGFEVSVGRVNPEVFCGFDLREVLRQAMKKTSTTDQP